MFFVTPPFLGGTYNKDYSGNKDHTLGLHEGAPIYEKSLVEFWNDAL